MLRTAPVRRHSRPSSPACTPGPGRHAVGLLRALVAAVALVAGGIAVPALATSAPAHPTGPGLGLTLDEPVGSGLFSPRGPDVSGHNHPNDASIDWAQVRAAGNTFAFVKATEGTTFRNVYFPADWKAVPANDMFRGAYHYARPQLPLSTAVDQAQAFLAFTGPLNQAGMLPPVLDMEEAGSLGTTDLVAWAQTWLSTVESATGRVPIIYTYPYFWKTAMGNTDAFTRYPLWIADYNGGSAPRTPLVGGWPTYTFWQFTSTGSIAGISGIVDNNRYCCGDTSLAALALSGPAAPPAPPAAPGRPAAPTGVTVQPGDGQLKVAWTAPAGPISSFVVTPYASGTDKLAPVSVPASATSTVLPGLANGTGYTVTVRATNAAGNGADSKPTALATPFAASRAATDPAGPASAEHPLVATVTDADGAPLTLTLDQGDPAPTGFRSALVGLTVAAGTAPGVSSAPGQLDIAVDASVLPVGALEDDLTLLHQGTPIARTCASPVTASCLASTSYDGATLTFSVRTPGAPTGTWTPVAAVVGRVAGADRMSTAVAVSQGSFPSANAGAVVLARADGFADALAGAPLAKARNAPLLLTLPTKLDPAVSAEIGRVLPSGGTVFLLGGAQAVSDEVASALTRSGYAVARLAGADRYATAVRVADALGGSNGAFVARGDDFADSLTAGAAAAFRGQPLLLTAGSSLPSATRAWLAAHPGPVTAVGGPAARAVPLATAVAGADRYATAAAVSTRFFPRPETAGLASGTSFPDALAVGPALARAGAPLLLSDPRVLPGPTRAHLVETRATLATLHLYGGSAALSATVLAATAAALAG